MIFFIGLLFSFNLFADEPLHWSYMVEIKDRHEFYKNNEEIIKPTNSWQVLFSVAYVDQNFKKLKDCVFYRVPGNDKGILKLRTISDSEKCDDYLLSPGDKEIPEIKSLQFAVNDTNLSLSYTRADFKSFKWQTHTQNTFVRPAPKMNLSSSEFKAQKITLLAMASKVVTPTAPTMKDKTLCHDINEDCEEVAPSTCQMCPKGWYEIPNGCSQGPKYCGVLNCGAKDQPACRRGVKWQKNVGELDCRTDKSFAYCSKGYTVQCEGRKAFCR